MGHIMKTMLVVAALVLLISCAASDSDITYGVDYTAIDNTIPASGLTSYPFSAAVTITNEGTTAGSELVHWYAYYSDDIILDAGDTLFDTGILDGLASGAASEIALSDMWPSVAGTYRVLIELSSDDDENAENDEYFSGAVSITASSRFVAVGDSGSVWWSVDGDSWTEAESTPSGSPDLNRVRYVGDRLVAVGDGGTLWTSIDAGVNWTAVATGTSYNLNAVAYGSGVYVVVGGDAVDGVTLTSTNGTTWNGPFNETGFRFKGLTFGSSTFFAVNGNLDWNTRHGAAVDVLAGNWTNGTYEVMGGRGYHTDYGTSNFAVIYTNLGDPLGKYSPTGATGSWTNGNVLGGTPIPTALRHDGADRLVAVGGDGTVWYTDDDGDTWTYLLNVAGLGSHMEDVVYGSDRWVAVGLAGQAWFSAADINTWTAASGDPGLYHFRGVAYVP